MCPCHFARSWQLSSGLLWVPLSTNTIVTCSLATRGTVPTVSNRILQPSFTVFAWLTHRSALWSPGLIEVWITLLEQLTAAVSNCPRQHQPPTLDLLFELLRDVTKTPGKYFCVWCGGEYYTNPFFCRRVFLWVPTCFSLFLRLNSNLHDLGQYLLHGCDGGMFTIYPCSCFFLPVHL